MTSPPAVTVLAAVLAIVMWGVIVGALLRMDEPVRERVVYVHVTAD